MQAIAAMMVLMALMALQPSARADVPSSKAQVQERFAAAAEAMAAARWREATEAYEAVAQDALAQPALAADALFSAAELRVERLGEPTQGLALYEQLLARFPRSRVALAAQQRAEALRAQLGPLGEDTAAIARWNELRMGYGERSEVQSQRMAEALIAEYSTWSGLPAVALWLANLHTRRSQPALARRWFREVVRRWPDSKERYEAQLGGADAALALGDFDTAIAEYRALPVGTEPSRRQTQHDALSHAQSERRRHRLYVAALALLILTAAGFLASLAATTRTLQQSLRALVVPPIEVVYLAPGLALLMFAAYSDYFAAGPAVATIAVGGLAITWLSGAALAAGKPPRRARSLAHIVTAFVAVLALCYIALYRAQLVDLVLDTVRFGPA